MLTTVSLVLLIAGLLWLVGFTIYIRRKYTPIIARILQLTPRLDPRKAEPLGEGEPVDFASDDGIRLRGNLLPARSRQRAGVILFCHEFLGDRSTVRAYADPLRDLGFDIFTFDFRNHGESDAEPGYEPLQWTTDRELADIRAAIAHLRSRPDADPAGLGIFGISRGGASALCAAAEDRSIWGVITDSAFPTRGMLIHYMKQWAGIYSKWAHKIMPEAVFAFLAWTARRYAERERKCRYPDIERAAAKIGPRPWLMIHGEKDSYVVRSIAEGLYASGRRPKELWAVEGAKHNGCLDINPGAYCERLADFLTRFAPRPIDPAAMERLAGSRAAFDEREVLAGASTRNGRAEPAVADDWSEIKPEAAGVHSASD